jgi:hypothetical protein
MSTINQIRANRRNAKKSKGPKTPEGKERTRFNGLIHGLRAESAVLPGEDQGKFDQLLEQFSAVWKPRDHMEKSLVEQIAVNQWKLARIDRHEAKIYAADAMSPGEFALAIHRLNLTQVRLERSVSSTIADLERYRKAHPARSDEPAPGSEENFKKGVVWTSSDKDRHYISLPQICGLDGVWREIPREVLGDFSKPPA